MRESISDGRASAPTTLDFVFRQWLPLEREMALFLVASLMDFLLTRLLLTWEGPDDHYSFVETNPIARYFLYSWGFNGLIAFKATTVSMVIVVCQIIARTRMDIARRLFTFATLAVMTVVVYSAVLVVRHT